MNARRVERLTRAIESRRFTSDAGLSQPQMVAAVDAVLRAILEDHYRVSEVIAALQEYPRAEFQVGPALARLHASQPVSSLPDDAAA